MSFFALAVRGVPLPASASLALTQQWGWRGEIVTRAFPADIDPAEIDQIYAGGTRARLRQPDRYSQDGVPHWDLDAIAHRETQKVLDRLCLDRYTTHNVACNAGRTVTLNFIANAASLHGVQEFAVGTGTPPAGQSGPLSTDTQLFSEFFRKAPSSTNTTGNQEIISTTFLTSEANTTYTEAGIFGNGATGTANSGTIFAHAAYTYTKTNSIVLTNQYTIFLV